MRTSVLVCILLSIAPVAAAHISDEPIADDASEADEVDGLVEASREGGYLGIGGGYVLENSNGRGGYSSSGSVAFRVGVRGLPNLAVELLGEVLPRVDGFDRDERNDESGFTFTVNGKFLLPLGRVEPWAMAGIGLLSHRRSGREDFAFRSAVGADVYLSRYWAVYGEVAYLLPAGEVSDFDYATAGLGVLFRF